MTSPILLALAIVAEVVATLAHRSSEGFTRAIPTLVVIGRYGTAFYLLSLVLRQYEIGFVYAVWSGAGTALIAAIGMLALGEPATAIRIGSIALIVAGVVGLNLSGGAH